MAYIDLNLDEIAELDYQLDKDLHKHIMDNRGMKTPIYDVLKGIKDKLNNFSTERQMLLSPMEVSLFYSALTSAVCYELDNDDDNSKFMVKQYEDMIDKIQKDYYGMVSGR